MDSDACTITDKINWTLTALPVKSLKEHAKNPRQIGKEQLARLSSLIDKFGLIDKPIVNADMTIIGGHQRIKVLKKQRAKSVDCWLADRQLTEDEIDELCIGLNLHQGSWDWEVMANQWDALKLLDYGFTEEQLLGASLEAEKILSADDDEEDGTLSPAKDEDAITKPGDLYTLGDHRLICGDSTDPDVVTKLLDGAEPILMVTDPPYGVEYDPAFREKASVRLGRNKAQGKVQNDDRVNWALAWHLFPGSVAYTWCASWFLPDVAKSLDEAEFERKSLIIWVKQHFALSRGDYHWQHEPCWYAVKKGHQHNWQGARDQATIWEIANLNAFGGKKEDGEERTAHSTQKPIECMARPIRNNTAPGEGVYDPFLGSGTTLIAAEKLGRKCYGIELSPAYCDIIVRRYVRHCKKANVTSKVSRNGDEIDPHQFDKPDTESQHG